MAVHCIAIGIRDYGEGAVYWIIPRHNAAAERGFIKARRKRILAIYRGSDDPVGFR